MNGAELVRSEDFRKSVPHPVTRERIRQEEMSANERGKCSDGGSE